MPHRVLLLCCGAWLCGCESYPLSTTPHATVTGARLLNYGVYRRSTTHFVPGPNTSEGRIAMFDEAKLLKRTDKIRARVNTVFGIQYMLVGTPTGAAADLVLEVVHPIRFSYENPLPARLVRKLVETRIAEDAA